jgi:hypothetical protein
MEEWTYVDDRELVSFTGSKACMTCSHFTYGVDGHCRTLVACNLKRQQLQQGEHLVKQCKYWSPTWSKADGWAG